MTRKSLILFVLITTALLLAVPALAQDSSNNECAAGGTMAGQCGNSEWLWNFGFYLNQVLHHGLNPKDVPQMYQYGMPTVPVTQSDGNPETHSTNNECMTGGRLEDKCGDSEWLWTFGWWLHRVLFHGMNPNDVPQMYQYGMPRPEEVIETNNSPQMAAGCYDSSTSIDFDIYFNGQINQAHNLKVFSSKDGSCSGGSAGYAEAMEIYFVGTQANALLFCQSINPAITYIENALAQGYPVPNQYFWNCA